MGASPFTCIRHAVRAALCDFAWDGKYAMEGRKSFWKLGSQVDNETRKMNKIYLSKCFMHSAQSQRAGNELLWSDLFISIIDKNDKLN